MGSALYIVLEKDIAGLDTMIDGKALSRVEEKLAMEAQRLGVRPLMEFFSADPGELAEFLGEDAEIPDGQWFSAEDGLKTIRALINIMDTSPELSDAKSDMLEMENVLKEAEKQGIKWHLAVDY